MTTPLDGFDLNQYKLQAKELLSQARSGDPDAILRIRENHPEHDAVLRGNLQLADTQLVFARERGFSTWPKFKEYIQFRNAVNAVDCGDIAKLENLLTENPHLIDYKCTVGQWYESGYFSGAGLIQHVAGNPIRHRLAANIIEVTQVLLAHGADPNSSPSTIGLLMTGKQASEAHVSMQLIDLLIEAGAKDNPDLNDPRTLDDPIWHGGIETAIALVNRGAKIDLAQAAALGRFDMMRDILKRLNVDGQLIEVALIYAAVQNQYESAVLLLDHGAKGDLIPTINHHGAGQATALHNAAWRGNLEMVKLMLDRGANPNIRDNQWNGIPADWANHGGHDEVAQLLRAFAP